MEFSILKNQTIIDRFVKEDFSPLEKGYPPLFYRATMAQEIVRQLGSLSQGGAKCDFDVCSYNKEKRGNGFLQDMAKATLARKAPQSTPKNEETLINGLYIDAIRFLKEYELISQDKFPPGLDGILQAVRKGILKDITKTARHLDLSQYPNTGERFSLRWMLQWTLYEMPPMILSRQIGVSLSSG